MLRSVYVRFILVNVLIVLLSVAGTAALAGKLTSSEYDRFVRSGEQLRSQRLVRILAESYAQAGNWSSVEAAVDRMSQINGERVAVVDLQGSVIADSGRDLLGQTIPRERLATFPKITVQGAVVGYLVLGPMRVPPPYPGPQPVIRVQPPASSAFRDVIYRLLLASAGVAAVIAIVATLVLTRRMLRPVVALTDAAHKMAQGDLSIRVKAGSTDEIGSLARAFNAMADSLARNEQLRRNMVNDVAHELRTPLTNLRGYLEAARDGMIEPDRQYIDSLYEETMLLNRLTNDLQELSLAEAKQLRLTYEDVDLRELAESALDAIRPRALDKSIQLRLDAPSDLPVICADPTRIGQVLRNLLNNALDFTSCGGEVTVLVRAEDNAVRVEVRDTGYGIAAEHLPFVFERFYRVDSSRARSTGGAGLGLTIVKNLVEAHGGSVWVESTVGVGSTFGFSLPVGDSQAERTL